ncbi:hypothetical protein ABZ504_00005, partial [Streptomyces mirabilis]
RRATPAVGTALPPGLPGAAAPGSTRVARVPALAVVGARNKRVREAAEGKQEALFEEFEE